ncbi:outer membrane channel protein [Vibrio comitans NBRC 102076]|uniref:Outer membrane channel protein n=1 Tax=Vibrio comitans NBRC 102076 TaxID=1219078 RepID=A0A4Y3IQY2_9VIBR|nr:outer membrane channel protein [Vibrio comitans NBRC 102076]
MVFSSSSSAESLSKIYEQAKQYDSVLLQAAAQRDIAFQAIDSARAPLLPQVSLAINYDIARSDDFTSHEMNTFNAGVGFFQQLYDRTSWINLSQSEMAARQADAQYAGQNQQLIFRVTNAYFDVLKAQDNLTFVQAEKLSVKRQLEQIQQRFAVGLSAITDVHDAQAQYDSVLANEVIAKNRVDNSFEELRQITGQQYVSVNALDVDRFQAHPPQRPIQQLEQEAQQKNLDLLAARINKDIAKSSIRLASAGHLPSLNLGGGVNYVDTSETYLGLGDASGVTSNIAISFDLPIYSGGATSSQVKQAELGYISASEQLEFTYRDVSKELRRSHNDISASVEAIRAYQQVVTSAQTALEASEAGFEVGSRTIVDVLAATRNLYDANQSLADARYNYIVSSLLLKLYTGTLSEQDILDINNGLTRRKNST